MTRRVDAPIPMVSCPQRQTLAPPEHGDAQRDIRSTVGANPHPGPNVAPRAFGIRRRHRTYESRNVGACPRFGSVEGLPDLADNGGGNIDGVPGRTDSDADPNDADSGCRTVPDTCATAFAEFARESDPPAGPQTDSGGRSRGSRSSTRPGSRGRLAVAPPGR